MNYIITTNITEYEEFRFLVWLRILDLENAIEQQMKYKNNPIGENTVAEALARNKKELSIVRNLLARLNEAKEIK